jgi:hypothetical protein
MKGNSKTLVIFVVIAMIAMLLVVSMASAGPPTKITGVFAGPARISCIVTTSTAGTNGTGFNEDFQLIMPLSPAQWWTTSETADTIVTFYRDGTVFRQGHSHSINDSQDPSSSSSDYTSTSLSSGVHPGKSFTTSYSINDGIILTGVWKGVSFAIDNITFDGWYSLDGKTITSFSTTPKVETETFSNGFVYHRICTRSSTIFKIH